MALPPEKLNELKQVIHSHLNQLDIHGQIRNVLSESLRENEIDERNIRKENLLSILKEKGIVDDVMKTLEFQGIDKGKKSDLEKKNEKEWMVDQQRKFPIDPGKRYLYVQFLGGKAFLEYLQESEVFPGRVTSFFTIHLNFMGQRYQSRPVACACEPAFEEGFLLELKKPSSQSSKQPDASMLLASTDKIHIVLIKTDPSGDTHLLGSHFLEWRGILCSPGGRVRNSIELNGVGAEAKVPIGIIDIRMDLIPRLSQIITTDVTTAQLNLERGRVSERNRLFLTYSKQWWREFLQVRATHSNRLVKIFAQDETSTHRLVCSYVRPLKAGRLLDTPRQAARFVSLLSHEKFPTMGGTRGDMWTSVAAFVSRKKGDAEDHAVLLCSLLLGFGMNAFVCIGSKGKGVAHAWVVTIGLDATVLFWESLTGQRYKHEPINPNDPPGNLPPKPDHPYRTVGCVFNHNSFYANSQPTDGVHVCLFDILDESLWKSLNPEAIKSVCGPHISPTATPLFHLLPSKVDTILKSNELENELRVLVFDYRQDLGLTTIWDDELSYLLSPALAAYEFEHCNGVSVANDDFQHAVRRYVPDGHTFKGFPIQFIHLNARRAFATCLRSPICEEIIGCRGDQVRLAVRCRVFTYPEDTCAAWIMFAVKYKSIL